MLGRYLNNAGVNLRCIWRILFHNSVQLTMNLVRQTVKLTLFNSKNSTRNGVIFSISVTNLTVYALI